MENVFASSFTNTTSCPTLAVNSLGSNPCFPNTWTSTAAPFGRGRIDGPSSLSSSPKTGGELGCALSSTAASGADVHPKRKARNS